METVYFTKDGALRRDGYYGNVFIKPTRNGILIRVDDHFMGRKLFTYEIDKGPDRMTIIAEDRPKVQKFDADKSKANPKNSIEREAMERLYAVFDWVRNEYRLAPHGTKHRSELLFIQSWLQSEINRVAGFCE